MFGFKPNVKKLLDKADHEGLGKLLRHKDSEIRKASAQALIKLLKPFTGKRKLIVQQFKGVNDKEIISVLMNEIEKLSTTIGDAYSSNLVRAVLLAGGINELIEFNKKIAKWDVRPDGSYKENILNDYISRDLIGYSVAYKFSIKELLEIIPYAVCQVSDDALSLESHIRVCGNLTLSKAEIDRIKGQIDSLPDQSSGLDNFNKIVLGELLLSKLKAE